MYLEEKAEDKDAEEREEQTILRERERERLSLKILKRFLVHSVLLAITIIVRFYSFYFYPHSLSLATFFVFEFFLSLSISSSGLFVHVLSSGVNLLIKIAAFARALNLCFLLTLFEVVDSLCL